MIEVALSCAAAGGLVVLKVQGLPAPGGMNFFLSTAPVLVAVPAAVLVVRGYPVLLGWLLRITRGGRGVTGFVGLARSTRTSLTAVLPAFALVLALAVVAFGGMVRQAVLRGEIAASWLQTGADAVVGQPASGIYLTPAAQAAIARVPGVRHVAGALDVDGTLAPADLGGTPVHIAVLDPASYAAVLADTPAPPFPARALAEPARGLAGSRVPVLVSPSIGPMLRNVGDVISVGGQTVRVRVAGDLQHAGHGRARAVRGLPALGGRRRPGPADHAVRDRTAAGPAGPDPDRAAGRARRGDHLALCGPGRPAARRCPTPATSPSPRAPPRRPVSAC